MIFIIVNNCKAQCFHAIFVHALASIHPIPTILMETDGKGCTNLHAYKSLKIEKGDRDYLVSESREQRRVIFPLSLLNFEV